MLENVETMFDNMRPFMKKLKKKTYEENMAVFYEKNIPYFEEMTSFVEEAEDKDAAAGQIARTFVEHVDQRFMVKGKIPGYQQADLNFFMIYYTFPALLKTGHMESRRIADHLCAEWGSHFKDSKINYTDYETIYGSFREKILGIF